MKKFLLVVFLLILPAIALASDLSDRLNAAIDNEDTLSKQIDVLENEDGKRLINEKTWLRKTDELLKLREKHLNEQNTALLMKMTGSGGYEEQYRNFKTKLNAFDAKCAEYKTRCDKEFEDQSDVDACNQEKDQLDVEAGPLHGESARLIDLKLKLKREKADLDTYVEMLRDRRDVFTQATKNWMEKQKNYNADHADLIAAHDQALVQLQQLSSKYADCIAGLPAKANDQQIKARCGNVKFNNVREVIYKMRLIKVKGVVSAAPSQ